MVKEYRGVVYSLSDSEIVVSDAVTVISDVMQITSDSEKYKGQ